MKPSITQTIIDNPDAEAFEIALMTGASIRSVRSARSMLKACGGDLEAHRADWRRRGAIYRRRHGVQTRAEYKAIFTKANARRDAVLRKHYHKKSATEIAAMLGTTRNAVIGRARRIGLSQPTA